MTLIDKIKYTNAQKIKKIQLDLENLEKKIIIIIYI